MALLVAAAVLAICIFCPADFSRVGLSVTSPAMTRLSYPFFHASIFHVLMNVWCLLAAVFAFRVSAIKLMLAFAVAFLAPAFVLSELPTVGLSAVCFALLGYGALRVQRKLFYSFTLLSYIAVGSLLTGVNAWIHLYAYAAGILIDLPTVPLLTRHDSPPT